MAEHVVYCVTHAYGAPFPDAEGRAPRLQVLSVSADGSAMTLVQEVALPVGSDGFMTMQLNASNTKLVVSAGASGVAVFEVDPINKGQVVDGKPPVCSPVTSESMPTPLGVFPVWVSVCSAEPT